MARGRLSPQLDDAVVVKGRHLTVHAHPSVPVCAGAIAVADRFVEDTAAMLGIEPPSIDYYLFDGPTGCGSGQYATASCAISGTVFANHWIHFHELVHAVDDSHPPALFVEGLAEALSTSSSDARRPPVARADAVLPLESWAFRTRDPIETYAIAGDFVRYLVERFGAASYRTFARSLASLSEGLAIRRQFRHAFGAALDDVIADWRAADPATSTLAVPVDLAACMDPLAPVAPDTWAADGAPLEGCTSGQTANSTTYTQYARRFGFEVATPGVYAVRMTADGDDAPGHLRGCAGEAYYELPVSNAHMARISILPLPAGRHAIETMKNTRAWHVARLGAVGETCETATTVTAPEHDWRLEIHGRPSTWVRLDVEGSRGVHGTARPTSPARACTGPCSALRCQQLAAPSMIAVHDEPLLIQLGPADGELAAVTLATPSAD